MMFSRRKIGVVEQVSNLPVNHFFAT